MGTKNYSINHRKDGTVIYEIDGALFTDLARVPDESDRAMLAAMQDGSFERELEEDSGNSIDAGVPAAEAARMRMIFLLVFGTIAVIMLLVAAISSYDAYTRSGIEERAPGLVVDTVEEPGGENMLYSYPVVEFTDRDGRSHTVKVPEGSSPPQWAAGDAVTVLYDPGHPADARIDSWSSTLLLWLLPGVTGIVGIGFLLAVFLVLRVMPPGTR